MIISSSPVAFSELLARIQALLAARFRSTHPAAGDGTKLVVGDLELDYVKRTVIRGGQRIELQPREFSLLEYLMRNAGRPVSKTLILEHVWDYHFDPQTNVVDVLVCRLRGKLDRDFETAAFAYPLRDEWASSKCSAGQSDGFRDRNPRDAARKPGVLLAAEAQSEACEPVIRRTLRRLRRTTITC